jgi:hypothetical protein
MKFWVHRGSVHARVQKLALLCALLAMFSGTSARAAAPVCDPLAQSIAAPVPMRFAPERELRVVRCVNDVEAALLLAPLAPAQQPELTLDLGQRVLPVALRLTLSAPRAHAGLGEDDDARPPAAFDAGIYRPPRS